jgi:hypothetical protein
MESIKRGKEKRFCESSKFQSYLDDWLTVHRSITLVDFQLDAQILIYFYMLHLLKSLILINVLYKDK